MQAIVWAVLVMFGLGVLSRVAWYVRTWLWVRSQRDPKARLEAEILWRTWRRGRR